MKRFGQKPDESIIDYLRRAVSNLDYEPNSILEQLKTVDAVLDYFDLWHRYGTDFWQGVLECISEGDDPVHARQFVEKHNLHKGWLEDIEDAVNIHKEEMAEVKS